MIEYLFFRLVFVSNIASMIISAGIGDPVGAILSAVFVGITETLSERIKRKMNGVEK